MCAFGAMSLLGIACTPMGPGDGNGNGDPAAILPANYRDEFQLVRDCRNSIPHVASIRVYANEIGADGYLGAANVLPEGTMLVKEEFDGTDCDDDTALQVWSVMLKREAGFDPAAGDWRFQEIAAPDRRVTLDGKETCIACHSAAECVVRDYTCTEP